MSFWQRWFGKPRDLLAGELPPGPVTRPVARWGVSPAEGGPEAEVIYGSNAAGEWTIEVRGGVDEVAPFLTYYLLDPLNTRPIHVEGLGAQPGPHTRSPEQFDRAMHELPIRMRAWSARLLG